MEENVDSIKESNSRKDGSLKKFQIEIDSSKEPSTSINKNQQVPNKEEIDNKKSNNMLKDPNNQKVENENPKS